MKTIPPAHAEHQLTHVANRFDEWRQTRTTRTEPIPQHLWEQAIALTTMFPITRVATRLRVSGGELKKRCAAHHAVRSTPAATAVLGQQHLSGLSPPRASRLNSNDLMVHGCGCTLPSRSSRCWA